jgi:hypothetical protein
LNHFEIKSPILKSRKFSRYEKPWNSERDHRFENGSRELPSIWKPCFSNQMTVAMREKTNIPHKSQVPSFDKLIIHILNLHHFDDIRTITILRTHRKAKYDILLIREFAKLDHSFPYLRESDMWRSTGMTGGRIF